MRDSIGLRGRRRIDSWGRLRELEGETAEGLGVHPLLFKARKDAVRSQLADLEDELREYEGLKSGGFEISISSARWLKCRGC